MKPLKKAHTLFLLWLWILPGYAPSQTAQTAQTEAPQVSDETFRAVADKLRCPTCTGLSVLDSEAKFSVQIKDQVREQLLAGKNKDEILAFFSTRYGPWILRQPPTDGINALVWWFPSLTLVLGPIVLGIFMLRKKKVLSGRGIRTTDQIIKEMRERVALRGGALNP